jgi:hypothetical protein
MNADLRISGYWNSPIVEIPIRYFNSMTSFKVYGEPCELDETEKGVDWEMHIALITLVYPCHAGTWISTSASFIPPGIPYIM